MYEIDTSSSSDDEQDPVPPKPTCITRRLDTVLGGQRQEFPILAVQRQERASSGSHENCPSSLPISSRPLSYNLFVSSAQKTKSQQQEWSFSK